MFAASAVLKVVLLAGQLKLATVGFSQVGMSDAQAAFYAEHFSVQLASVDEQNVRVTTPKDMAAVLGVERQKALLGCADDESNCMAELAGALGADGLVTGQIAKVGNSFQLNVKVLAADGTKTLFLHSSKLLATEEELIEELNDVASRAVARLRPEGTGAAVGDVVTAPGRSRSKLRLIPGAVGLVALVVGAVEFGSAASKSAALSMANWPNLTLAQAEGLAQGGKLDLTVGAVALSLGLALVAVTLFWYLL